MAPTWSTPSIHRRPSRRQRRWPTNWPAPARGCSCCWVSRSRRSTPMVSRSPGFDAGLVPGGLLLEGASLGPHGQRAVERDHRLHAAILLEPARQLADADRGLRDRPVARLRRALPAAGRTAVSAARRQHAVRHPADHRTRVRSEGQFRARAASCSRRSAGSALTGTRRYRACRRCATRAPRTCTRCWRCSRGR